MSWLKEEFKLIEDNKIDIDSIEEYEFPAYANKLNPIENKLLELINENRRTVKQLNKEIKSIKEKNI